ncbi:MAG: ribosomal protein L32 [Oscillospiraceae bacterium]|nr:ribosomal protein L32 [Oscillospiraceae bacterium]
MGSAPAASACSNTHFFDRAHRLCSAAGFSRNPPVL